MSNGTIKTKQAAKRNDAPNTYENMRKAARKYLASQMENPKSINGLQALGKLEELSKEVGDSDKVIAAAFYLLATNSQLALFIGEWGK